MPADEVPTTIHSSPAFRAETRPSRVASVALALLFLPSVVMLAVGVAVNGFEIRASWVLLLVAAGVVSAAVAARRTAAVVICDPEAVVIGLVPFWRTRLRRTEIAEATLVQIDAFAEYGGWGIKGSARSERGRLYSVGGRVALRLRTLDGRTFVVAFSDTATAEGALAAVDGVGDRA